MGSIHYYIMMVKNPPLSQEKEQRKHQASPRLPSKSVLSRLPTD